MNDNYTYKNNQNKQAASNFVMIIILLIAIIGVCMYLYKTDDSFRKTFDDITSIFNKKKSKENDDDSINLNNCINNKNVTYSNVSRVGSISGLDIKYNGNDIYLTVDQSKFSYAAEKDYKIDGITKEDMQRYFIDQVGTSYSDTYIFFLRKSGVVSYAKLFNNDKAFNLVNNVLPTTDINEQLTDITNFYGASSSNGSVVSHTVLARRSDKSFYDLSVYVSSESKDSSASSQNNDGSEKKAEVINPTYEITDTPIDLTKPLNSSGYTYSNASGSADLGLNVVINGGVPSLEIDFSKFGPLSGISNYSNNKETYKIKNVKGKVIKGFIGGLGQDIAGTYVFLVLQDGKIEYFPVLDNGKINYTYKKSGKKITDTYFKALGPLHNVSQINDLYNANACLKGTCANTVLARISSGSFYDLGRLINKY